MEEPVRPRCFFDVAIGGLQSGRICFELFSDVVPITCDNFRALCAGDKGIGETTQKPLSYNGSVFHRVVKDFIIQGGDFSSGNGTGGESIYGGTFEDENFTLKHDKPFLLSMANRGKDTNGSQFFITTQPAPHLDDVHVVFGRVVSGVDVVRQIESLPVDSNSRPLQDAKISKCGELIRQVKVKKEKKKKKSEEDNSIEESENDVDKKKHKKEKKKDKKEKKQKKKQKEDSEEEGEVKEDEVHPLVSVTNIDPEDIPDVPVNKFLMRGDRKTNGRKDDRKYNNRDDRRGWHNNNYNRRRQMHTKSGRAIKGRGVFRFRTPSRSRSRSVTPVHWKKEEARIIKLSEYEKKEASHKLSKETNNLKADLLREKANEDESFSPKNDKHHESEYNKANKDIDYNALDYEDNASDEEDMPKKQVPSLVQYPLPGSFKPLEKSGGEKAAEDKAKEQHAVEEPNILNKRSDALAMALGVQIKSHDDENPVGPKDIVNLEKKNPLKAVNDNEKRFDLTARLLKMAGTEVSVREIKEKELNRRNKFESEKPTLGVDRFDKNRHTNNVRNGRDFDSRRVSERRRIDSRPFPVRPRRNSLRNMRRSPIRRRSADNDRGRRSKDRARRSKERQRRSKERERQSMDRSNDRVKKRSKSKSPEHRRRRTRSRGSPGKSRDRDSKLRKRTEEKISQIDVEKVKRRAEQILLLKKKMELEILKKKKDDEERLLLIEKQRKAKEEAEMLEKAKKVKREAIEKEKLLRTVKALQELDKKGTSKRRSSSSSSSTSSSSSSSSGRSRGRRRRTPPRNRSKRRRSSSSSSGSSRNRNKSSNRNIRSSRRDSSRYSRKR